MSGLLKGAAKLGSSGLEFLMELLGHAPRKSGALDLSQLSEKELRQLARTPQAGNLVFHGTDQALDLGAVSPSSPLFVAKRPAHGMYYAVEGKQDTPLLHVFEAKDWKQWPRFPEGLIPDLDSGFSPFLEDQMSKRAETMLRFGAGKGRIGDVMLMPPRSRGAVLREWDIGDHSDVQGLVLDPKRLERRASGGLVALRHRL